MKKEPLTENAKLLMAKVADKDCLSCKGKGGWPCDCEASLCLHESYWVVCQCIIRKPTTKPKEASRGK